MNTPFSYLDIRLQGNRVRITVPHALVPVLDEWVGRIQKESGLPVELDDVIVASAKAFDQKVKATKATKRKPALIVFNDIYESIKTDAIAFFHVRRQRAIKEADGGKQA